MAGAGGRAGWWKYAASLIASAVLLWLLARNLDGAAFAGNWSRIAPGYALLAVALYLGNLIVRSLRLRRLGAASGAGPAWPPWIRLAALHQLLFSVLPSGLADIGFPVLASRVTGCNPSVGARLLFTYRIQDLWALAMFGGVGLVFRVADWAVDPVVLGFGLMTAAACLIWSNDLTRALGAGVLAVVEHGPGQRIAARSLRRLAEELRRPASWRLRLHGAWATLAGWALAAASLWSLFMMIELRLGVAEVLLIIAGMNLVGTVAAFTVAGLGVSEVGLAAILLALGFGAPEALVVALIVRPAALGRVVISCGLIECGFRLCRRFRSATRPTGETAAGPAESSRRPV